MSSTLSPTQSEFYAGRWPVKSWVDATVRPADLKNEGFPSKRPSLAKRASRAVVRFLIAFCIGIAATLAWQHHGDAAREMIASSSPQLGWLAPQAVPVAQTAPDMIVPAAPADPSPDREELKAISSGLAAVQQSVDQLAATHEQTMRSVDQLAAGQERLTRTVNQLTASQEQMTRDITKLQAAEQNILHKLISTPSARPAAAPTRKPAPPTPQAPPVDSVQ
jgi:hypothetical protein